MEDIKRPKLLCAQMLLLTQHLHPGMHLTTDAAVQIFAVKLRHLLPVLLSAAVAAAAAAAAAAVCHEIGHV